MVLSFSDRLRKERNLKANVLLHLLNVHKFSKLKVCLGTTYFS